MSKIINSQKKWLLTLHVILAGLLLGNTFGMLILTIIDYNSNDHEVLKASYHILHILGTTPLRITTTATIISGIALAIVTKHGLFRFYWIITKELLSVLAIIIGYVGIQFWSLRGITILEIAGASSNIDPQFVTNQNQLLTGIILQLISLITIFAISIFKPWGVRRRARNLINEIEPVK